MSDLKYPRDFETSVDYYNETFVNGNRNHMVEEIVKMNSVFPPAAMRIIAGLDDEAREFFERRVYDVFTDLAYCVAIPVLGN